MKLNGEIILNVLLALLLWELVVKRLLRPADGEPSAPLKAGALPPPPAAEDSGIDRPMSLEAFVAKAKRNMQPHGGSY